MATCKLCGNAMFAETKTEWDEPDSFTTWDVHVVKCGECDAVGLKAFHGERATVTRLTRDKTPWVAGNAANDAYDEPPFDETPPDILAAVAEIAK